MVTDMVGWRHGAALVGICGIGAVAAFILAHRRNRRTSEKPPSNKQSNKPELPTPCIFCDNNSGSEEHLWAAWIHRRKPMGKLRVQIGNDQEYIDDNAEQTINTVCHPCNNGWMSRLEEKNIPALGDMLENRPTSIDAGRQRLLAEWAVKTAMVMDSMKDRRGDAKFYTREECLAMRLTRAIPEGTRIWIGALNEWHIGAFNTDFALFAGIGGPRIGTGIASTIVVGHFVVQVVTIHVFSHVNAPGIHDVPPKPGGWDNLLIQLLPKIYKNITWPPKVIFTNGGPLSTAYLMDRWRIGEKVKPGSI
jgi:hypothetical protein